MPSRRRPQLRLALALAPRAGALVVVTAVLIAPGCGGLEPGQYERELVKIHDRRIESVGKLGSADTGDVKFYAGQQKQMQLAADDLDRIQPPGEVRKAHDTYVDSLYGLARVMGKLADCARLQQRSELRARACRAAIEQSLLDEVQNDFFEAYTILRHEGYDLAKPPDL